MPVAVLLRKTGAPVRISCHPAETTNSRVTSGAVACVLIIEHTGLPRGMRSRNFGQVQVAIDPLTDAFFRSRYMGG